MHGAYSLAETMADLPSQREAVRAKRAETTEKVRTALGEYSEAVTAYNAELVEAIGTARRAGLIEGQCDPTLPIAMGGGTHGHPRRLTVDGAEYSALNVNTDSILQEARR